MYIMLNQETIKGSGSGKISGKAGNMSGFGKPTALEVLSQTKTSLFNQTTLPNTGLFGSTTAASVFGQIEQESTVQPTFEGLNAGGTCSLFGTPTATSTSNERLFGQQNASMEGNTGGRCLSSSNSNTSFQQSKPFGTPLAQPTSNIFGAPQISTAFTGIFGASTTGSGSGELSNSAANTSKFGEVTFGKTTALTALSQTKTSHNQTTLHNTGLFGSTAAAPVFCQTPTAHPIFEGLNAGGTCSLFGTPTATSTSNERLFGQQNASMEGNTGGRCLSSSNSNTSFQQSKPFGTPLAQPTSNIFGAPQTSTAVTGIFGASTTGLNASGTCSLFGTPTATSTSNGRLFGQQYGSMERNTGDRCFSSSNSNTSFQQSKPFGTPLAQSTSIHIPQTRTEGTGIFSASSTSHATSGCGATSAGGTTTQFNPVTGTDTSVINGVIHKVNTRHQSITVMKEYETKAFEELRFEYYFANRKVGQQGAVGGRIFESPKSLISFTTTFSQSLFGANDNKPLFGATLTIPALGDVMTKIQLFAAPQTNIFGSTVPSTFGTQSTGFYQTGFGQHNQNNLFGQNKSAFDLGSIQTTSFGFGTNTSTSAHGLFGSKHNTGFQMTTSDFGTDNTFGTTLTAHPSTGRLFVSRDFDYMPTTSLFNQTTNNLTGVFNVTNSGEKWKENTRNEGTGLFDSKQQTGEFRLFEK